MLRHPRPTLARPRPTLVFALGFHAVASLAACTPVGPPKPLSLLVEPVQPPQYPVPSSEAWDECFRVSVPETDTGGQGTRLVGVGASRAEVDYPRDLALEFAFEDGFSLSGMSTGRGLAIEHVEITKGELVGTVARKNSPLRGSQWKDVHLSGSLRCPNDRRLDVHARIAHASQARDGAWVYSVEIERPGPKDNPAPSWVPACGKNSAAMPMARLWDEKSGNPREESDRFSFACTDAIVAKCSRQWEHFDPSKSEDAALYAACTRMGRADYWGNGEPHTKDNTSVRVSASVEALNGE